MIFGFTASMMPSSISACNYLLILFFVVLYFLVGYISKIEIFNINKKGGNMKTGIVKFANRFIGVVCTFVTDILGNVIAGMLMP
jgi:hypothetical protein